MLWPIIGEKVWYNTSTMNKNDKYIYIMRFKMIYQSQITNSYYHNGYYEKNMSIITTFVN